MQESKPEKKGEPSSSTNKLPKRQIVSTKKLIKKLDGIQSELDKIRISDKSFEELFNEAKIKQGREKHYSRLLLHAQQSKHKRHRIHEYAFSWKHAIICCVVLVFFGLSFTILRMPVLTGYSVASNVVSGFSNSDFFSFVGVFLALGLLGTVIYATEYRYEHRYDKYKPPGML